MGNLSHGREIKLVHMKKEFCLICFCLLFKVYQDHFCARMATAWEKIIEFYDSALQNGDKRTDPWFLVYSPVPVSLIFILYLSITKFGPGFMKEREPLNLRVVLIVYNFALVCLSAYMFVEFQVTSFKAGYSYFCQPVDYSNSELGLRVFFILRKKFNQITFLHVYHHATMIFNWWAGVKYVAGGQSFFIGMLNSFVHIFMYLYYGLAALGPHMQQYLWWKRYLTILQLLQFFLIAVHTSYNLFTECAFPDGFNIIVFVYIVSLIILFSNFYFQSYIRGKGKAKQP
ncbi:elongation of very long chain fatty acids protein 4-like isoform X2 [Protopterus annectens]|uniref:elongation of very long chain fatty acids protein 4-like isoform X2 n=1 Tax=Protopterus annectens TaxID=7888 RepID=UPI001CFAAF8B|nr:elongation of very long chain fatty acids protein 4-like isoform X2 [Protopterus annectens]